METDEQTTYIIHHLSEGDAPQDLVFDLCQKYNLSWPEAEKLVQRVQTESVGEITRKQFPLMIALALVIFIAGLGLLGYSIYLIGLPLIEGSLANGTPMDAANFSLYVLEVIVGSRGMVLVAFVGGIGMVLGSLLGMRDIWSTLLNK